jgi:uncharacterized cupredoxin-like copper-binding protein
MGADADTSEESGETMSKRDPNSLTGTIIGVLGLLLVLAVVMIVALVHRPAGALNVPKGYASMHVTVTDYAIQAPSSVPAGKYEVVLVNHGTIPHELVMWNTKRPADALPRRADGSVDEESASLESVLDSGSSLQPGETRVLFADLTTAGHYALVCNLPSHYKLGMHADLTAR